MVVHDSVAPSYQPCYHSRNLHFLGISVSFFSTMYRTRSRLGKRRRTTPCSGENSLSSSKFRYIRLSYMINDCGMKITADVQFSPVKCEYCSRVIQELNLNIYVSRDLPELSMVQINVHKDYDKKKKKDKSTLIGAVTVWLPACLAWIVLTLFVLSLQGPSISPRTLSLWDRKWKHGIRSHWPRQRSVPTKAPRCEYEPNIRWGHAACCACGPAPPQIHNSPNPTTTFTHLIFPRCPTFLSISLCVGHSLRLLCTHNVKRTFSIFQRNLILPLGIYNELLEVSTL